MLFTGYHKLPQEELYWFLDLDCNNTIVCQALSRQRFIDMKINLHLNDNSAINKDDKLFKVRQYIELLNKKFQQFAVHKMSLSIDEQMILYQGCHSVRMFIKGKPIRFGYKAWTLSCLVGMCMLLIYIPGTQTKRRLLRAPLDSVEMLLLTCCKLWKKNIKLFTLRTFLLPLIS